MFNTKSLQIIMKTTLHSILTIFLVVCAVIYSSAQQYPINSVNGTTVSTCGGTFVDSGGTSGNYGNNQNYTVTFCSDNNSLMTLEFTQFDLQGGACDDDYLTIYDGNNTSAPEYGTWCGSSGPGKITASGECLTINFVSNGSTNLAGWNANLGCFDCLSNSCSNYVELDFSGSSMINDPSGLVGDRWRFDDVLSGFDALVEITAAVNISNISRIDHPSEPTVEAFAPEIRVNRVTGQSSYVDFKITLVAANTFTPTPLPKASRVTSYDVDGNGSFRERHGHINPNGYITNDPTELSFFVDPPYTYINGSTQEHNGISDDDEVKATFYYASQLTEFNIRQGIYTTNGSGSSVRQFALSFEACPTYANPNVNPIVPNITGDFAFCGSGSSGSYSIGGSFTSVVWSVDGGTITSGQGTSNVNVSWSGTGGKSLSVETTDGNGCIVSTSKSIVVSPGIDVDAGYDEVVCSGENVSLSASGSNGLSPYSYSWSTGSTSPNINVNPSASQTYVVTVVDGNNCAGTDEVSVLMAPTLSVSASTRDANTCSSDTLHLRGHFTNGVYREVFESKNGTAISDLTSMAKYPDSPDLVEISSGLIGPSSIGDNYGTRIRFSLEAKVTGTYDIGIYGDDQTALYWTGSASSAPFGLNMLVMVPGWSGIDEFNKYSEQTAQISLSAGQTYYFELLHSEGSGGDHYGVKWQLPGSSSWTEIPNEQLYPGTISWTGPGFTSNNANPTRLNANSSFNGSYSVDFESFEGCSSTSSVYVSLSPTPQFSFVGDGSICVGESTNISSSVSVGDAPFQYLWSDASTGSALTVSPVMPSNYGLTITDANGCSSTGDFSVNTLPSPLANAGPNVTIKKGHSTSLQGIGSGGTGSLSYSWNQGLGAGQNHEISPTVTTTYQLTVTDNNGCAGIDNIVVNVLQFYVEQIEID